MTGPGVQDRLIAYGGLEDADLPLAEAALDLAKWTEPQLNIAPYHRHLELLASDVRAYIGRDVGDPAIAIEAARQILARRYGYSFVEDSAEDTYRSSLARTIDRRRASTETLAILYAHVLSEHIDGLELLDFSTRILLGVMDRGERHLIDPRSDGRTVSARDLRRMLSTDAAVDHTLSPFSLQTLSRRAVLVRLQDDIKAHHLRRAAPEAAIQALEASILLAPEDPRLWRELGVLYARTDQLTDGVRALKRFLALPSTDTERYTASQLLQELTHRIKKGDL